MERQTKRLEKVYPFVYMDALMIPIKGEKKSGKCAVYTMIGVNMNEKEDCFGFWIGESEGTHQWLSIFDELKSRGVERMGIVCIDGLQRLEEAITNTFPTAVVCRCMVHPARNSTKYIPSKCRKEFCADLKEIYGAISKKAAQGAHSKFNGKWEDQYPSAVRVWNEDFCYVERLFAYPSRSGK